jgi:DNA-binding winged helix-turn-helix (wHTH) protein
LAERGPIDPDRVARARAPVSIDVPKDDFPVDEESYAFGSFRLAPAQRELLEDGKPLRLGSRAFDILVTLVESAGETIGRDQLIARAWPDTVVDEGALRVHVAALPTDVAATASSPTFQGAGTASSRR